MKWIEGGGGGPGVWCCLHRGIVFSEGEMWSIHRRLSNPYFNRPDILDKHWAPIIQQQSLTLADRYQQLPKESVVDLAVDSKKVTLEVVGRGGFSTAMHHSPTTTKPANNLHQQVRSKSDCDGDDDCIVGSNVGGDDDDDDALLLLLLLPPPFPLCMIRPSSACSTIWVMPS